MKQDIAYLIQTPDYIPDYVKILEDMGRDVYLLSFKKPLEHKNNIFFPESTCWEGKNKLAEIVPKKYLYYISVEDDVELYIKEGRCFKNKNPWEVFEHFLIEYKPAVGTIAYEVTRKRVRCEGSILAYHKDVMKVGFPVYTGFDNLSWWWTGSMHIITLIYAFYLYVYYCDGLEFANKLGREYCRAYSNRLFNNVWKKSFLYKEDKDNFKRVFYHEQEYPTLFLPPEKFRLGDYAKMAENFKNRVDKNHIFWKDHPFING